MANRSGGGDAGGVDDVDFGLTAILRYTSRTNSIQHRCDYGI